MKYIKNIKDMKDTKDLKVRRMKDMNGKGALVSKGEIPGIFQVMRRYMEVNRKHRWLLVATILFSLLTSVVISVMTQSFHGIIDNFGQRGTFVSGQTVVLLIALVILTPSQYLHQYLGIRFSESCDRTMRDRTFAAISRMDKQTLDVERSGDLLSRGISDLNQMNGLLQNFCSVRLPQQIIGLVALIVSMFISWRLTLFSLGIVPIIAWLQIRLSAPVTRLVLQRQRAAGESLSVTKNLLDGYEVARAYNLASRLQQRYDGAVDQAAASEILAHRATILLSMSGLFMAFLPQMIMCGFGVYLVSIGQITSGGIISIIILSVFISAPIRDFPSVLANFQTARSCASRLFELWDLESEPKGGKEEVAAGDAIIFDNVMFSYREEEPLLNRLSFSISRGEHVALVGASGSGKSTIFKLLTGLYRKQSGAIIVLGHPLEAWSTEALRQHISYVGQDTYLFPGTIWDNVALGNPEASDEQIQEAIDTALLNDLDVKLEIGEQGFRLSGGQRQRVAIARAILKDAPLLILDEPAAALDTHSEALVTAAIRRLMEGRTTIVIAHRLSALRHIDRVLCLHEGQIVESGTHEQLMGAHGIYYRLFRSQEATA